MKPDTTPRQNQAASEHRDTEVKERMQYLLHTRYYPFDHENFAEAVANMSKGHAVPLASWCGRYIKNKFVPDFYYTPERDAVYIADKLCESVEEYWRKIARCHAENKNWDEIESIKGKVKRILGTADFDPFLPNNLAMALSSASEREMAGLAKCLERLFVFRTESCAIEAAYALLAIARGYWLPKADQRVKEDEK